MVSTRKVINDDPSAGTGPVVPRTWEDGSGGVPVTPSEVLKSVVEKPSSVHARGRYWVILSGFRQWSSHPEVTDVKSADGATEIRERPDAGRPGRGRPPPRPPPVTGIRSPDPSQKVKTVPLPPSRAHELEKVWA